MEFGGFVEQKRVLVCFRPGIFGQFLPVFYAQIRFPVLSVRGRHTKTMGADVFWKTEDTSTSRYHDEQQ
jgi:hypothetical protein